MDSVILVDRRDRRLGEMDKVEAHRGEGQLHRAVSVLLFDSRGNLLMQQRSPKKIVGALQWANTCCGNVQPTENRLQCARRRLREELGIEGAAIKKVASFTYQVECEPGFSEHEVDAVFVGGYEGKITPNSSEVTETHWVDWEDVKREVLGASSKYAPWFKIMIGNDLVRRKVEKERTKYVIR